MPNGGLHNEWGPTELTLGQKVDAEIKRRKKAEDERAEALDEIAALRDTVAILEDMIKNSKYRGKIE